MSRRLILLICTVVIGALLIAVPHARSAGEIAPRVIDTNPPAGAELSLDGRVTFLFDQAMDRASVEAAFSTDQRLTGTFIWADDRTVTFAPSAPLSRASSYTFRIGNGARSAAGTPIKDTFTLRLNTIGALLVSQIIPADQAQNIADRPTIIVMFNRPVVPLLPVEEMAALPSPITISPAVEGKGQWSNTSIYTFTPSKPLVGGQTYTVTVNAGLTDVTGSVLEVPVKSTFSIVSPRIIEVLPTHDDNFVALDRSIYIAFSQPMDQAATEAAFSLVADKIAAPVKGTFTWNPDGTALTFKPDQRLDYQTIYHVSIDWNRARSANGAALQEKAFKASFRTVELPKITSTAPENGQVEVQYGSGITFYFNAPINLTDFAKRVTVEPKPGLKFEDWSSDDNTSYTYAFSVEPSTSYTIMLDTTGLVDKYGTPLQLDKASPLYTVISDNTIQLKFTTAPYPAEASLKTNGDIGLYSAYAPTTRVYTTHRNIDKIDLSLYSVPSNDLLGLLSYSTYGVTHEYKPNAANHLRSWTLAVENPLNILRYDLLEISAEGPGANGPAPVTLTCPGAPATRLQVGMTVVVLRDDPRPIRVRAAAGLQGRQITQLNPGVQMTVIGGPVCSDGYVWWQIRTTDNRVEGWAAEGDQSHYFIGPVDGAAQQPPRPVVTMSENKADKPLKPGAYLLYYTVPALSDSYYGDIRHLMLVSTANIAMKITPRSVYAWVTDLQSGQPVPNVNVQFISGDNREAAPVILGTVATDANGLAVLELPQPLTSLYTSLFTMIDDGTNFAMGAVDWDSGISPWEFGQTPDYGIQPVTAYIYSDRSLYRPGQPVYFRGVLRDRNDMTYTLHKAAELQVQILNNDGQVMYDKKLPLTPFGTFAGDFALDDDAALGVYTIQVTIPLDDRRQEEWPTFTRQINVAQYRVPEFQVKVEAATPAVVQGDTAKINVDSTYFFGGAVSNAKVTWSVFADNYYFRSDGLSGYDFYDFNWDEGYRTPDTRFGDEVAKGESKTDDKGHFVIEVPASLGKSGLSQQYTIEAQVTDESDQLIAGRATVIVHQGEFYIGAKPQEYIGTADKATNIDLVTVNWDGQPVGNLTLNVRTVERKWRSIKTVEPATGRTVWDYEVEETPVTEGTVTTNANGRAVYTFTPKTGGVYKIYAASRDGRGNQVTTSTFVWVAGPDYVPWRQQNSNRIDLRTDKDNYNIGETASILIASPFQGAAKAWITIERGKLLHSEVIDLPTNSTIYKLPITADMAPNTFISVTIIKGVDDNNPVAAFRMGLVGISVNSDRYKLNIEVTPDKPMAGPREDVTYTLKVTDWQGQPVQAEVGVGLTDLAVLSLLPDTSTPIIDYFYQKVGLSVRTANTLTISVDQRTQEILNTIKGGGGGGPEGGIFEVRQRFIDTPLWVPNVVTDAQGIAQVKVTLPDNLTTWRLDARAVTLPTGELGTTLVGQTTVDLISTKPVLIRPITPRFYVIGDQSTLVAVVNNNSGTDQQINVNIDVKGATLKTEAAQSAVIAHLGRHRFEWQIDVQDVNALDVTFFASTADGKYTDAAKSAVGQGADKTLPVLRYEVPETVATSGLLTKEESTVTEGILLPTRYDVTQGYVDVRLDRSLASATIEALSYLEYYPYFCTEQTVSRFLPNLATYGALRELNIDDPALKASLDRVLNISLQRLYADQHTNGGWGWFINSKTSPLVSGYALIGLAEAQKQGIAVDNTVLNAAINYVQGEVGKLGKQPTQWQVNREAFLLYALAYAKAGNYGYAVNLFEKRGQMSLYAKAYLAMAFNLMDPTNTRYTDVLISDLSNNAVISGMGAKFEEDFEDRWNWNTDTRTTALALKALIQMQPNNPLIPQIVRWLMSARQADHWETTQETTWAVMALTDWMRVSGELQPNYTFSVNLNDKALLENGTATPANVRESDKLRIQVSDLLKGEVNRLAINRSGGEGNLYYTATLKAYLPVPLIKPLSRGLTVTRQYTLVDDPAQQPITQAHVGDNIRVTVTIVAPSDLQYVVINDPIPAGAESINPLLNTSVTTADPGLTRMGTPGYGWWWFDNIEMRDEQTVLFASYLPQGTYQFTYTIRAGLAGVYNVIPTTGQEMYYPDVYGRSEGIQFTLLPATSAAEDPTQPATATPNK